MRALFHPSGIAEAPARIGCLWGAVRQADPPARRPDFTGEAIAIQPMEPARWEAAQRRRYADNCAALAAYPYCFRTDFPDYEALFPRFVPTGGDDTYVPVDPAGSRLGPCVHFREPVIDRYFFRDLEDPILARDVYSQYQLEYLNDNVRRSEWVGRDNHIYLHYTDWAAFCARLPCLDLAPLLAGGKFVILAEAEIDRYPIDFRARYGIDYSRCPVRPLGVREVCRLIWHAQLSTHNGGDFFNEIFYGHPNLIAFESLMFGNTVRAVTRFQEQFRNGGAVDAAVRRQLDGISDPTDKDVLVAMFLSRPEMSGWLDRRARIVPAFFYQPHFENIHYQLEDGGPGGACICHSPEYEAFQASPLSRGFRYVKTFSPVRRPTTSYAATLRYMAAQIGDPAAPKRVPDVLLQRVLNRSYLRADGDRLFRDSILVRFEDGKLNPAATFTKLAEFLDIPYTASMTVCSSFRGVNVPAGSGNAAGFDPAPVYRTYDEYAGSGERTFLEYFLRELYALCGYDFHHCRGGDGRWTADRAAGFPTLDGWIRRSLKDCARILRDRGEAVDEAAFVEGQLRDVAAQRRRAVGILLRDPELVDRQGRPLLPMPVLRPDPALLEQPLYR